MRRDLVLDLKRVQAEYANYRRRTEEQREVEIARAKGSVAEGLLPVLDDLDRAEKHGDLVEGSPLAAIAEKLRAVVARLGVETYGVAGEVFDPQQHEAIFHAPNPGAHKADRGATRCGTSSSCVKWPRCRPVAPASSRRGRRDRWSRCVMARAYAGRQRSCSGVRFRRRRPTSIRRRRYAVRPEVASTKAP